MYSSALPLKLEAACVWEDRLHQSWRIGFCCTELSGKIIIHCTDEIHGGARSHSWGQHTEFVATGDIRAVSSPAKYLTGSWCQSKHRTGLHFGYCGLMWCSPSKAQVLVCSDGEEGLMLVLMAAQSSCNILLCVWKWASGVLVQSKEHILFDTWLLNN